MSVVVVSVHQDPWLCPEFAQFCHEEGAKISFSFQQCCQPGHRLLHDQAAWGPWTPPRSGMRWGVKHDLHLPPGIGPPPEAKRTVILLRSLRDASRLPFLYIWVHSAVFLSHLQCFGS